MAKALTFFIALCTICGCLSAEVPLESTNAVGMARIEFFDDARPAWTDAGSRPLSTTIWYPAQAGVQQELISFPADQPIFSGGLAARNATIANEKKYPFVLLSHGTGGSALQMMWLGRALASRGFIAAAIDHHGNTAAEDSFDARGFRMPWQRALDLSALLDQLIDDPIWAPRIDNTQIGAAGFSLGGYTVTALAGGQIDFSRFGAFCESLERDATCDPQPEYPDASREFAEMLESGKVSKSDMEYAGSDFSDPRISTYVTLAPALIQALTDDSLKSLNQPILVIVGDGDRVAPLETNAKRLSDLAPTAGLRVVEGASHYTFLNPCTEQGQRFVPVCKDGAVSRDAIQADVIELVVEHFATSN
ncbi:MAG: alpha/beta fold hydrolase [Pseudomonadota bacterium]